MKVRLVKRHICLIVTVAIFICSIPYSALAIPYIEDDQVTYLEFGKEYSEEYTIAEEGGYQFKLLKPTTIMISVKCLNVDEIMFDGNGIWADFELYSVNEKRTIDEKQNFLTYNNSFSLPGGIYQIDMMLTCCSDGYRLLVEEEQQEQDYAPKIILNNDVLNLKVGKSKRLEFEVSPEGFYYDKVKWESSNEKVAKVNYQGRVDAVGLGQAEITATLKGGVDGMIAKCLVTVDETDKFVFKGDKIRLPKINDVYRSGWKSGKKTVVTSNNYAKGIKQGKSIITKKVDGITYKCNVYVTDAEKLKNSSYNYSKTGIAKFAGYYDGYPVVARRSKIRTVFGGYYYRYDLYRYKTNFKVDWYDQYNSYDDVYVKKFKKW